MNNQTTILTSIIKEYADKILDGSKKYEFRKKTLGTKTDRIYIYESRSNIKDKIVGYFDTEPVSKKPVTEILDYIIKHPIESGISYAEAKKYFGDNEFGYMYPIKHYYKFRLNQNDYFGDKFRAPQNFIYIDDATELKMFNAIAEGLRLKEKLNTYSTKEFPNLKKDLKRTENQYFSLNNEGYVVVNKEKNKIVRIEKLSKECNVGNLISFSLDHLDADKFVYVNVPTKRQRLINSFIEKGFEIDTIFENKYANNDKVIRLAKNI